MAKNVSERHHYVPEMLSKRFTDGRWLWYYDEEEHRHGIRNVTPRGAFWRRHLNTIVALDGTKNDAIERRFATGLERHADSILEKIVTSVREGIPPRIEGLQRAWLQQFTVLQFKRSPNILDSIMISSERDEFERDLRRLQEDKTLAWPTGLRERIGTPEFLAWAAKTIRTLAVAGRAREAVAALSPLGLYFLKAADAAFAIGSSPIVKVKDGSLGGEPGKAVVLFPIAYDVAIVFGPKAMNGNTYTCNTVMALNKLVAQQSIALAANDPALVQFLLPKQVHISGVGLGKGTRHGNE